MDLGTARKGPGVDPAALAVFNSYPLPNDPTVGDGLNISGFTFADPTPAKLDTYIVKLDYNLTSNGSHHLFLRGNLQNDHVTTSGAQFPGPASKPDFDQQRTKAWRLDTRPSSAIP